MIYLLNLEKQSLKIYLYTILLYIGVFMLFYLQLFSSGGKGDKKMSDDPFADHDFEIKIDMDLSTTSKWRKEIEDISLNNWCNLANM